jgi:predicted nuclease of predicted toxin-antitoxin system
LKLLLDEHIWPGLASMVKLTLPAADVESIHTFSGGRFLNCDDAEILREARRAGRILVTFDVNTIPALLHEMAAAEELHSGVIFISAKSFAQNDHQGLALALAGLLRDETSADWTNRVMFLHKRTGEDLHRG